MNHHSSPSEQLLSDASRMTTAVTATTTTTTTNTTIGGNKFAPGTRPLSDSSRIETLSQNGKEMNSYSNCLENFVLDWKGGPLTTLSQVTEDFLLFEIVASKLLDAIANRNRPFIMCWYIYIYVYAI